MAAHALIRDPRTGRAERALEPLGAAGVAAAAAKLRAAQPAWAALPASARAEALAALADAMGAHADAIVAALARDTGRARVARVEFDAIVGSIRRWAARAPGLLAAAETTGRAAIPSVSYATRLVPYGLVGVIAPWNFPLLLALTDAIPALAAGCAVLVKPSEVTPRFIAPLTEAVATVPQIAQVLRLVEGDGGTGAALVAHSDFIAFTGSVATGRRVGEAAARAFIPASLELGGKDPLIVLASADPVRAAAVALSASCRATGQACQSIERAYVARPILAAFLERLAADAAAVPLNTAAPDAPGLGPFISAAQAAIVQAHIDDAVARGARVLAGGRVEDHGGLWLRPTILVDVPADARMMTEETFGPVLPVAPFDTEDEAAALANSGDFGLSAAVCAGTLPEAERFARRLNAGAVSLNDGALTALLSDAEKSSFGLSGIGPPRSGTAGLTRFCRTQALYAQGGEPLPLAAFL